MPRVTRSSIQVPAILACAICQSECRELYTTVVDMGSYSVTAQLPLCEDCGPVADNEELRHAIVQLDRMAKNLDRTA